MATTSLFKKNYLIELSDIDFRKQLKLSTLFNFFQDIASLASIDLGYGIDALEKQYSVAWVLIKIRVDIIKNPTWNEEITIETWPQEPKSLEFERDFLVKDQEGNILIRAVSTWVILDIHSRRIKRSKTIGVQYPDIIETRALDEPLSKLQPFGEMVTAYNKVIGYSDVDLNGHLNNARYIDYIMDCFSVENHKEYGVSKIEVNFVSEALPGETIVLKKDLTKIEQRQIYIEGINEETDKVVFKAEVEIEPIK